MNISKALMALGLILLGVSLTSSVFAAPAMAAPKYHSFVVCDTASSCQTGGDSDKIGVGVLQHPQSDDADWSVLNGQNIVINDVTVTVTDGSTIKPNPAAGQYTYTHANGNRLARLDVFGDDVPPPTTTTTSSTSTTSTTLAPTTTTTVAPTTTSTTVAPTTTTTVAPTTTTTPAVITTTTLPTKVLPRTGARTNTMAAIGILLLIIGFALSRVASPVRPE